VYKRQATTRAPRSSSARPTRC